MPHDPTLALPVPVPPVLDLKGPSDTLAYAGAARPRPFLLLTRGCSARGVETRGVETVEMDGRFLLGGLGIAGASCGNVLLAPTEARRELVGRGGTLLETLLVTPEGLIAQWMPAPEQSEARVVLRLPGERWRTDGPLLGAAAADGARLLQILPEPTWSVREERGELVVTALVSVREGVRMVASMGSDGVEAAARLRRLTAARAVQAESALVALRTRRLATNTGVADIDDALAWAIARADAVGEAENAIVHELAHGEPFPTDPDARRAWTVLGQLASGRTERPRLSPDTPLGLYALARAAEWRGEPIGRETRAALDSEGDRALKGAAAAVQRAALLVVADVIEPWEGKPAAETLRARASRLAAAAPRPGGLRLPTIGASGGLAASAPSVDPLAALTGAALDLPGHAPLGAQGEDPPPGVLRALTAWACLNDGLLDRGFALFRQHLADGFTEGVGLWSDGGRIHDPCAAALVPLVLLHGLIGARIDAHHGRLRLAPRLPTNWNRFSVGGIVIGDATVRMSYDLADGRHRFRFVQDSGAVPVMLVFEPLVAAGPNPEAWVDGARADLETSAAHGRLQAKVQLPLDREREVAIATG